LFFCIKESRGARCAPRRGSSDPVLQLLAAELSDLRRLTAGDPMSLSELSIGLLVGTVRTWRELTSSLLNGLEAMMLENIPAELRVVAALASPTPDIVEGDLLTLRTGSTLPVVGIIHTPVQVFGQHDMFVAPAALGFHGWLLLKNAWSRPAPSERREKGKDETEGASDLHLALVKFPVPRHFCLSFIEERTPSEIRIFLTQSKHYILTYLSYFVNDIIYLKQKAGTIFHVPTKIITRGWMIKTLWSGSLRSLEILMLEGQSAHLLRVQEEHGKMHRRQAEVSTRQLSGNLGDQRGVLAENQQLVAQLEVGPQPVVGDARIPHFNVDSHAFSELEHLDDPLESPGCCGVEVNRAQVEVKDK